LKCLLRNNGFDILVRNNLMALVQCRSSYLDETGDDPIDLKQVQYLACHLEYNVLNSRFVQSSSQLSNEIDTIQTMLRMRLCSQLTDDQLTEFADLVLVAAFVVPSIVGAEGSSLGDQFVYNSVRKASPRGS
jgi:hypothetical protein